LEVTIVKGGESMLDILMKRFDEPDEVRTFDKGRRRSRGPVAK
jgi:hypothetical protein